MRKNNLTTKIVRLAIFLALAIVLNIIESLIPLPFAIPGIRLGLANAMTLIVLYYYSPKEYVALGILRVFIVGLLRTGIGSIAFLLSLSGWLLSTIVSLIIYFLTKSSIFGLSITSAIFHQVGQITTAILIYQLPALVNYLPVLLITGAISGGLVAYLCSVILKLLNRIYRVKILTKEENIVEEKDQ